MRFNISNNSQQGILTTRIFLSFNLFATSIARLTSEPEARITISGLPEQSSDDDATVLRAVHNVACAQRGERVHGGQRARCARGTCRLPGWRCA